MKSVWISLLLVHVASFTSSSFAAKRVRRELYREHVDQSNGGKVPESYILRTELNKIDTAGLTDPRAQSLVQALRNTPLPEKLNGGPPSVRDDDFPFSAGLYTPGASFPGGDDTDNTNSNQNLYNDNDNFLFNSVFDSKRIFSPSSETRKPNQNVAPSIQQQLVDNFDKFRRDTFGDDADDDDKRVDHAHDYRELLTKPHLFTTDPYSTRYRPPPTTAYPSSYDPYTPSSEYYDEPEAPVSKPVVHDLYGHDYYGGNGGDNEYYPYPSPPTTNNPYETTNPYSNVQGHAQHSQGYEPRVTGPILLDKRPYEVTEIKELPVAVHHTYTGFDCRKAPYPDRHYADPEAGCTVYHFCHSNGKQDTFHCPKGTTFNEYLGTCDHSEAVYCTGGGQGYSPQQHHADYQDYVPQHVLERRGRGRYVDERYQDGGYDHISYLRRRPSYYDYRSHESYYRQGRAHEVQPQAYSHGFAFSRYFRPYH